MISIEFKDDDEAREVEDALRLIARGAKWGDRRGWLLDDVARRIEDARKAAAP